MKKPKKRNHGSRKRKMGRLSLRDRERTSLGGRGGYKEYMKKWFNGEVVN